MPEVKTNYGTNTTLDTLASQTSGSIVKFGEDRAFEAIDRALEIHNAFVTEMKTDFIETTADRERRFGSPDAMKMVEVDEFGNADAQKVHAGQTVGFPLKLYAIALQWTKKYMQNKTPAELAAQFTAATNADMLNIIAQAKKAIFTPTNTLFIDSLVDQIALATKALLNGDGTIPPLGPNGEIFAGSHSHYLVCGTPGTLAVADAKALTNTVTEHFDNGYGLVYIAYDDADAWRGLSGFVARADVRVIQPTTQYAAREALDVVNIKDRAIGTFNGYEVWVKPWIPAGYAFAWFKGQAAPLAMRLRDVAVDALVLEADTEEHPLRSRQFEREFGISCYNRANGAVLDYAHSTYTAPTITGYLS